MKRSPVQTLLLFSLLYFTIALIPIAPVGVHAQTDQITLAKEDLTLAFQSVQIAEQDGASNASLGPLITELNSALAYEMIAEQGNSTAALESINLSTQVSLQAQTLASQAQTASREKTILEYTTAVILAVVTATGVFAASIVKRELDKKRLLRSKIELRD